MSTKKPSQTADDLACPFVGELAARFPPVPSPRQLAEPLGKSPETVSEWVARGRLDRAYRKRRERAPPWRGKALEIPFAGKGWA